MTTFRLNIVFSGVDFADDEVFEALAELPDVYWRSQDDLAFATAIITAESALDAARLVVGRVSDLVPSAEPVGLDEDLVSIADIAVRAEVTTEAVRHWVNGHRRSGFPRPRGVVGGGKRIWAWSDVNGWLAGNGQTHDPEEFPELIDSFLIELLFADLKRNCQVATHVTWIPTGQVTGARNVIPPRLTTVSGPGSALDAIRAA